MYPAAEGGGTQRKKRGELPISTSAAAHQLPPLYPPAASLNHSTTSSSSHAPSRVPPADHHHHFEFHRQNSSPATFSNEPPPFESTCFYNIGRCLQEQDMSSAKRQPLFKEPPLSSSAPALGQRRSDDSPSSSLMVLNIREQDLAQPFTSGGFSPAASSMDMVRQNRWMVSPFCDAGC